MEILFISRVTIWSVFQNPVTYIVFVIRATHLKWHTFFSTHQVINLNGLQIKIFLD